MVDAWDDEPEGWAEFVLKFWGEDGLNRMRASAQAGREVRAKISAETGHVFGLDKQADDQQIAAHWERQRNARPGFDFGA